MDLQAIKQEGCAAWLTGEVDVVEEGPCRLAGDEVGLQRARSAGAKPRAKSAGINGSPCSPPSAW